MGFGDKLGHYTDRQAARNQIQQRSVQYRRPSEPVDRYATTRGTGQVDNRYNRPSSRIPTVDTDALRLNNTRTPDYYANGLLRGPYNAGQSTAVRATEAISELAGTRRVQVNTPQGQIVIDLGRATVTDGKISGFEPNGSFDNLTNYNPLRSVIETFKADEIKTGENTKQIFERVAEKLNKAIYRQVNSNSLEGYSHQSLLSLGLVPITAEMLSQANPEYANKTPVADDRFLVPAVVKNQSRIDHHLANQQPTLQPETADSASIPRQIDAKEIFKVEFQGERTSELTEGSEAYGRQILTGINNQAANRTKVLAAINAAKAQGQEAVVIEFKQSELIPNARNKDTKVFVTLHVDQDTAAVSGISDDTVAQVLTATDSDFSRVDDTEDRQALYTALAQDNFADVRTEFARATRERKTLIVDRSFFTAVQGSIATEATPLSIKLVPKGVPADASAIVMEAQAIASPHRTINTAFSSKTVAAIYTKDPDGRVRAADLSLSRALARKLNSDSQIVNRFRNNGTNGFELTNSEINRLDLTGRRFAYIEGLLVVPAGLNPNDALRDFGVKTFRSEADAS